MGFMRLQVSRPGSLYYCDCGKCGCTNYSHEWCDDVNEDRDAMEAGTYRCPECGGKNDPDSFGQADKPQYAARYSAPGYMDRTDWCYGETEQEAIEECKGLYGDDDEDETDDE